MAETSGLGLSENKTECQSHVPNTTYMYTDTEAIQIMVMLNQNAISYT